MLSFYSFRPSLLTLWFEHSYRWKKLQRHLKIISLKHMESKHRYIRHQRRNVVTIHVYEEGLLYHYHITTTFFCHFSSFFCMMLFLFYILKYRSMHIFHNGNIVESIAAVYFFEELLFLHQKQMLHSVEAVIEFTILKKSITCMCIANDFFFSIGYSCNISWNFLSLPLWMMCPKSTISYRS